MATEADLSSFHDANSTDASAILDRFIQEHETLFTFPNLSVHARESFIQAIFQRLESQEAFISVRARCLSALRILTRAKDNVHLLLDDKPMGRYSTAVEITSLGIKFVSNARCF